MGIFDVLVTEAAPGASLRVSIQNSAGVDLVQSPAITAPNSNPNGSSPVRLGVGNLGVPLDHRSLSPLGDQFRIAYTITGGAVAFSVEGKAV